MIIDGGPTRIGIESTIISLVSDPYRVMRPGIITLEEMADHIGPIGLPRPLNYEGQLISPGTARRHYAPKTPVFVKEEIMAFPLDVGIIAINVPDGEDLIIKMPSDYDAYCRRFYDALHEADAWGCREIWLEPPPPNWEMIWNRVRRLIAEG